MGNYFFEDEKSGLLKVEYTFGFIKINDKELRINFIILLYLMIIKVKTKT